MLKIDHPSLYATVVELVDAGQTPGQIARHLDARLAPNRFITNFVVVTAEALYAKKAAQH
jgi:hypothetical protein